MLLASLLIRVAETEAGDSWRSPRNQVDQIHLMELAGTTGRVLQRCELTSAHTRMLAALGVAERPRFAHVTPA